MGGDYSGVFVQDAPRDATLGVGERRDWDIRDYMEGDVMDGCDTFAATLTRVSVADTSIADAVVHESRFARVSAKKPGVTEITLINVYPRGDYDIPVETEVTFGLTVR